MKDSKTGDLMVVDCNDKKFRESYTARFEARQAEQTTSFNRASLAFVRISTTDEIIQPLARAFSKRAAHV
jgi:hypothetical protein